MTSGLGRDIREVFEEVGVHYSISRSGEVTTSGEYLDWEPNSQVTKPFIREYFLECYFVYNTNVQNGDVVQFLPSGELEGGDKYLVMNKTPSIFENEIIDYAGVLYKVNVSGELHRPSGEAAWPTQTYHKEVTFQKIADEVPALQTEPLFGGELEFEEELALLGIEKQDLYVPSEYNVQALDRYYTASGEYYMVESVKQRRFIGVDVVILSEDTR